MKIYKEMYYHLFNAVTDALKALEEQNYGQVKNLLAQAQQEVENIYLGEK